MEVTDAWSNSVASSSSVSDRYGFTQREDDTESGLQYFRARSQGDLEQHPGRGSGGEAWLKSRFAG